ncbi:hypothetical protein MRB53_028368 [Persea americana]|uniref:Uncharacterized protein n=1 Tax=Persea americana TaxID=3435 RepID=A0ACC2KFB8_PERAE|nr:hypothetical protein MRB53_028368 [Persea americana]
MPIHRVQIDPGSALNLISTTTLEELGIPPSKLSNTFVSIFGYDGSTQRPIGKIRSRLQIGDLISDVTVYAIKTPSCYNILLGRPWIHKNGVVPSTLHWCIKFVGDDGLLHRVFADKKPFKGKEVHFADSHMYKDEKEEKEEKITSFAGNLQKDKGKALQQSTEENKPSGKPKESNPSPFVVSFKSSKPLVITTKAKKTKQKTGGKFIVSFVSIIQDMDLDSEIEDDASSSQADTEQVRPALTPMGTPADVEDPASATFIASTSRVDEDIDLPGYLFEELPDKDLGSSSNWYDFSDDEEELSDDTDARFSDSEEPSSPKEVPYFDPVSAGDWNHLIASLEKSTDQEDLWIEAEPWSENAHGNPEGLVELEASENIVEKPPSNLPIEDSVQKINLGTPDNPRPVFISQGRFRPDVMDKIEQEVQKLKNVGFIREEQHPEWLANIVPVTKKNGQIKVCIDYRDLNNACPKDEFPLSIPEVMINNTCGFERMTFTDGFSGYNQIKMNPEDERHTSFRTPFGVYCYTVMPFGLKNAGATYRGL